MWKVTSTKKLAEIPRVITKIQRGTIYLSGYQGYQGYEINQLN